MNGKAVLADGESLSVLRWVPDYYVQDNEVYKKSDEPESAPVQLGLTNAKGETRKLWILYSQLNSTKGQDAPYEFALKSATWEKYTGLEVSHQPGQYGVWIGVLLMACGLVIAFYTQHVRIWAAVLDDGKGRSSSGSVARPTRTATASRQSYERIKTALQEELGGTTGHKAGQNMPRSWKPCLRRGVAPAL